MFMDFTLIKNLLAKKENDVRNVEHVIYMPTLKCNYRCHHCNIDFSLTKSRDELTAFDIDKIFKNSKLRNTLVDISGGEPFLKDDIIEIIKNLIVLGRSLSITTNGTFPKKINELIKELKGDDLNTNLMNFSVSIDGYEEIHDKIRCKGSFRNAIETLKVLKNNNINVSINTTISDLNINDIKSIKDYFKDFDINHNFIVQSMVMHHRNHNLDIRDIAYLLNKADIKFIMSKEFFKIKDCHAGYIDCTIDPYGTVYTCITRCIYYNSDKFIMGDLRKYHLNFDRLWLSSCANKARNNVKSCTGCYGPCEISREIKNGLEIL